MGINYHFQVTKLLIVFIIISSQFGNYSNLFAQPTTKRDSVISTIKLIKSGSENNLSTFNNIIKSVKKATANFDEFVFIAELNRDYGYHSELLEDLCELIAGCNNETAFFHEIAELIILDKSADKKLLSLAIDACQASTNEEKKDIEKRIEVIRKEAADKLLDSSPKIMQE